MGKYFKEDNNQRISKASQGVDVSFLVKRLILAQGSAIKAEQALIKGFGNKNYTILPGNRPLNYAKPGLVGNFIDLASTIFPKIRSVKIFAEIYLSGKFDKALSYKFNNDLITKTLNKQYMVPIGRKSTPQPVQLRQFLLEYDPETKLLKNSYTFTDAQLQEIAKDIEALDAEAVKWRNWKIGVPTGIAAVGLGGFKAKSKAERKLDPSQSKTDSIVQKIVDKSSNEAHNPREGK